MRCSILKKALLAAPVLSYPRTEVRFILDNMGIGAVVSQIQESHEKVTDYFSKILFKPEPNYYVTRRDHQGYGGLLQISLWA